MTTGTADYSVFSRAISLLLLSLILCAATVGSAHSHGAIAKPARSDHSTSLSSSGTTRDSTAGRINCSDCLTCQLHQNFASALLSGRSVWLPPALHEHYFEIATIVFHSRVDTPRRDRAPPFTS